MGLCASATFCSQIDAFEESYRVCSTFFIILSLLVVDTARACSSLAPGASVLIKPLTDESLPLEQRVDMAKQIRFLTLADWTLIERAFEAWPFAPKVRSLRDTAAHSNRY